MCGVEGFQGCESRSMQVVALVGGIWTHNTAQALTQVVGNNNPRGKRNKAAVLPNGIPGDVAVAFLLHDLDNGLLVLLGQGLWAKDKEYGVEEIPLTISIPVDRHFLFSFFVVGEVEQLIKNNQRQVGRQRRDSSCQSQDIR